MQLLLQEVLDSAVTEEPKIEKALDTVSPSYATSRLGIADGI
jgi:hypothetical protein